MQLICGINPVLEALGARERHFDRLLVVKGLRNRRVSEAIARASHLGVPLRFEPRETLDRMAAGVPHQGVIAVVSAKPLMDLDTVLDQAKTPAMLVVLDGVEDPRNLGAIIRTAEAAGADGVVLPERHSAGLSETVARASAGALEYVKVAQIGNMAQALERLKERGVWVVGFDATGTERWDAVDLRQPVALVLGGEGRGIRRLVRERCDHLVSLPLFGHVGSLNVSVAAGIALYEAVRQRGAVPSQVRPIPPKALAAASRVIGPGPDDGEPDPGRRHAHEGGTPSPVVADDDGEESPERIVILEDDDAAWWGAGPGLPADAGRPRRAVAHGERAAAQADSRQGRGRGRHGRRRDGPGRPPGGPREPAGDARPPQGGAHAADPGARGRRRKRGHGRPHAAGGDSRHPGGAGRPPNGGADSAGPAEGGEPSEPRGGGPDGGSGARPEGGGHRRRRRRRRH